MLEEVSAKSEMDQRYPELVRMAYLVLPGDRPRKYRLALARRIVDESLPQRAARNPGKAYVQVRTRVLARSMRPRWRLRIGLGRWLSALPVALPEDAQTDPLVELPPEVRAAYVLRTVEEMPYYVAHDQLVALGVRDARAALNEAAEVGEPAGPIAGLSVVRGPGRRPLLPVAVASVLTVVRKRVGDPVPRRGGRADHPGLDPRLRAGGGRRRRSPGGRDGGEHRGLERVRAAAVPALPGYCSLTRTPRRGSTLSARRPA
ncbi:MAG: hypothetical protein QOE54_4402, partial [Streptosporangiaceae bacterium]|nr:hypothetical protein [Streptosporangiaceae bacterium]